jgi:hypothetical protein
MADYKVGQTIIAKVGGILGMNMPKPIQKWLLFQYVGGAVTPLSRPFESKELAEKARSKYPEQLSCLLSQAFPQHAQYIV